MKTKEKTQQILNYIILYKLQNDGVAPTLQEIVDNCNVGSRSVAKYHLEKLIEAGYLEVQPDSTRAIKVIGAEWSPPIWYEISTPVQ